MLRGRFPLPLLCAATFPSDVDRQSHLGAENLVKRGAHRARRPRKHRILLDRKQDSKDHQRTRKVHLRIVADLKNHKQPANRVSSRIHAPFAPLWPPMFPRHQLELTKLAAQDYCLVQFHTRPLPTEGRKGSLVAEMGRPDSSIQPCFHGISEPCPGLSGEALRGR